MATRFKHERGVLTLQFVLLVPLLMMLLTTILQIALLIQAKFVVNYAAFCALRSAIVSIPAEMTSPESRRTESHNQINFNDEHSAKLDAIRRAAALPLTAISPVYGPGVALSTGTAPDVSLVTQLSRVALLFPGSVGGQDVSHQLLLRAHYAYDRQNTQVEIVIKSNNAQSQGRFDDHDLVTVRVTHRYYLTVPFANRLFGRPFFGSRWWGGSGFYYPITEEYTLPLEGEPLFPEGQRSRF